MQLLAHGCVREVGAEVAQLLRIGFEVEELRLLRVVLMASSSRPHSSGPFLDSAARGR